MKQDLNKKEFKGFFLIRDSVLYEGKSPSLRSIAKELGFKSPRSASLLIKSLEDKGYIKRTPGGNIRILKSLSGKTQSERILKIPLVGNAPCGIPFLAEENIEAMIPVSQRMISPGANYYLLRAVGDSMNKARIKNGDLLLVRQQPVANPGEIVVALIGDEATIKEFRRKGNKVILMPKSTNKEHHPIILDKDFIIQGVVIDVISNPFK